MAAAPLGARTRQGCGVSAPVDVVEESVVAEKPGRLVALNAYRRHMDATRSEVDVLHGQLLAQSERLLRLEMAWARVEDCLMSDASPVLVVEAARKVMDEFHAAEMDAENLWVVTG